MEHEYRYSGKAPLAGVIISYALIAIAAAVLGIIYTAVICISPIVYLNILATGCLGFAIGWIANQLGYLFKLRSNLMIALIALLGVLVGYYFAWVFDPIARNEWKMFSLDTILAFLDPSNLLEYVSVFYEEGFWTIGKAGQGNNKNTVSGIILGIVWFIEFGIISVVAWMATGINNASPHRVFCEACNVWCRAQPAILKRSITASESAQEAFIAGNPLPMIQSPLPNPTDSHWFEVDLIDCPNCDETQYVSLLVVQIEYDNKGNANRKVAAIVNRMATNRPVREALLAAMNYIPDTINQPVQLSPDAPTE